MILIYFSHKINLNKQVKYFPQYSIIYSIKKTCVFPFLSYHLLSSFCKIFKLGVHNLQSTGGLQVCMNAQVMQEFCVHVFTNIISIIFPFPGQEFLKFINVAEGIL